MLLTGRLVLPRFLADRLADLRRLLIEKLPFLGGTSTAVLDTFYGFWTPGANPLKVAGGIGDDVVAGLRRLGPVLERPNTYGAGTGITYHPDQLKVVWESLVHDAGVRVLLHGFVQAAEVRDGRVGAITVATKAGLIEVEGSVVIDASGDADLCHFAGFGYELAGELEPAQTLTTTFRMANVDLDRRRTLTKGQFNTLMSDAAASGGYDLPRREGSDHATPVANMAATIMTRLDSYRADDGRVVNASDPWFLTEAEMAGRATGARVCPLPGRSRPRVRGGRSRDARCPARRPRDPTGLRRPTD